jgi:AcrR family transcriptional regulator
MTRSDTDVQPLVAAKASPTLRTLSRDRSDATMPSLGDSHGGPSPALPGARSREELTLEVQDGRVQRGARNRELIIDALFALVESGELQPTAEQVAHKAGVGTRTVFRHFADMESLFAELHARIEQEMKPHRAGELPSGDLATRVLALVEQRASFFERVSPFILSGQIQRHGSDFLQQSHTRFCRALRAELERNFASELKSAAARASPLLDTLDLVASFEAWHRLRDDQGLNRARAIRVVKQSLLAAFAAAGLPH